MYHARYNYRKKNKERNPQIGLSPKSPYFFCTFKWTFHRVQSSGSVFFIFLLIFQLSHSTLFLITLFLKRSRCNCFLCFVGKEPFPLVVLRTCSLSLNFYNLKMVCPNAMILAFVLCGILWGSWICDMELALIGEILSLFSNISFFSFSFFSFHIMLHLL